MRFRRQPTKSQVGMIALLTIALAAIVAFAVPEVAGIISPGAEDTFSEWVWDLPLWAVLSISLVFSVVAVIAAWAGVHFIEGYVTRRRKERK